MRRCPHDHYPTPDPADAMSRLALATALLRCLDRHLDARLRLARARQRMKVTIISLGLGVVLVLGEALGIVVLLENGVTPPLVAYWGPLTAIGVGLVAFATLKATVAAHKDHTAASMAMMATKDELAGVIRAMDSMHADVREIRGMIQDLSA